MKFFSLYRYLLNLFAASLLATSPAIASTELRQFAADLLRIEGEQVVRPDRIISYSEPIIGQRLRNALDANRAQRIVGLHMEAIKRGEIEPDISKLLRPYLDRYSKAFNANSKLYENEYLDSLIWYIVLSRETQQLMLIRSTPRATDTAVVDAQVLEGLEKMTESIQKALKTLDQVIAKSLMEQVGKGMFSQATTFRALQIFQALSSGRPFDNYALNHLVLSSNNQIRPPAVNLSTPYDRLSYAEKIEVGKKAFQTHCASCHQMDGRGQSGTSVGDLNQSKVLGNSSQALSITLKGKGKGMPSFSHLSDDEVAASVSYMLNSFTREVGFIFSDDVKQMRK
jgi:mono/diheme cytochrome c family protein